MDTQLTEDGPSSEVDRSRDEEFDPPVDMMVNDFDDERTLDEEEALEQAGDTQNEVSELQRESEMPIEELMKMYGYGDNGKIPDSVEEGDEDFEEDEDDESPEDSELNQLYSEIPAEVETPQRNEEGEKPGTTARLLRYPRLQDKDGDDHDYQPEEDEWRKTIMIGSDYQALIPEGLCRYDDALPYENEDKILWEPNALSEDAVVTFLKKVPGVGGGSNSQITRDDEQALFLLLQCGFNVEEALRRRQMNVVAATDTMSLWSDEECRNFENGLRTYGKDFHMIQQNKVRTRSVGELVQFYYLWKKTERHDVFANEHDLAACGGCEHCRRIHTVFEDVPEPQRRSLLRSLRKERNQVGPSTSQE